jgi:hypothetical protein
MMNPFRLGRIAAEAEGLRLRGMVTRIAVRVVLGIIALLFAVGALVFAHFAAFYLIRVDLDQSYLAAIGILGGVDLLIAIILVVLASRSRPSRVERESLEVRRKAIEGLGNVFTMAQLATPALRMVNNLRRTGRSRV